MYLFSHLPEELPQAARFLKASSALSRQLTQFLVTKIHVSDPILDHLRVTWSKT